MLPIYSKSLVAKKPKETRGNKAHQWSPRLLHIALRSGRQEEVSISFAAQRAQKLIFSSPKGPEPSVEVLECREALALLSIDDTKASLFPSMSTATKLPKSESIESPKISMKKTESPQLLGSMEKSAVHGLLKMKDASGADMLSPACKLLNPSLARKKTRSLSRSPFSSIGNQGRGLKKRGKPSPHKLLVQENDHEDRFHEVFARKYTYSCISCKTTKVFSSDICESLSDAIKDNDVHKMKDIVATKSRFLSADKLLIQSNGELAQDGKTIVAVEDIFSVLHDLEVSHSPRGAKGLFKLASAKYHGIPRESVIMYWNTKEQ